jgi:hypothetical protein
MYQSSSILIEKGCFSVSRRLPLSNLPFLRKKNDAGIAGVMVQHRSPDAEGEGHKDQEDHTEEHGLKACAKDLMDCISAGDEAGVAKALRAAFDILDSEPHVEGPHTNEDEEE